jgi:site-specific DNA-cytosine methylase
LNSDKIILDLCGGTGAWSAPYREAGYTVKIIDPYAVTVFTEDEDVKQCGGDVRLFRAPDYPVHGVLAAPPCTNFSYAKTTPPPTAKDWVKSLAVVDACLRVIRVVGPRWWALENPRARLRRWLGPAQLEFYPCDYGDPYTKKTCLWGDFTAPAQRPVTPTQSYMERYLAASEVGGYEHRRRRRAITPPGFARSFFEANP